jgi:hypothetical protein
VTPAAFSLTLAEDSVGVERLSFNNSGDAALTYTVSSTDPWIDVTNGAEGSLGAGQGANVQFSVACGAGSELEGSVSLSTNDADEGSVVVPVTVGCVPSEYEIARVTLNQGARSFDSATASTMSMSTIAGRDLLVRAFVTGTGVVPDAEVLVTSGGSTTSFSMARPTSIGAVAADESVLVDSHHAVVPGGALSAGAQLRVVVAPSAEVPARFPTSRTLDLAVSAPDTFAITFVPVTFEGETPSIDTDLYLRDARKVLPLGDIDAEVRAPYVFTDAYDLGELLTQIAELRDIDGSSRLYHAVIIPPDGATSNTAGIGYVGYPASVSIDLSGEQFVVAHELGHNLNLGHAPGCSTPDTDDDYPHADGGIGVWGYDLPGNVLVPPTASVRDFMSYCPELWVSDYHFTKAMNYRDSAALDFVSARTTDGLTVSGRLTEAGAWEHVRFTPVSHVAAEAVHASSAPFRLRAWDVNGVEVIDRAFTIYQAPDLDETQTFHVSVPRPAGSIAHYAIERGGSEVFSASVVRSSAERTLDWQPQTGTLRWQPQGEDALIVRDADGVTIAVDRTGTLDLVARTDLSMSHAVAGEVRSIFTLKADQPQSVILKR